MSSASQLPTLNSSSLSITSHDPASATDSRFFTNSDLDSQPRFMEREAPQGFTSSGLQTPYYSPDPLASSEEIPAEHAPVSQVAAFSTPTSDYGSYPTSARSSSFPAHIQQQQQQQYRPSSRGTSGGMAQPTSPSMSLQDGSRAGHPISQVKSDQDVPIDPSIAASSPTYPTSHGGQYSPYPPQQEMSHGGYQGHPQAMYAQPRPDWAGYGHSQMQGGYSVPGSSTPTSGAPPGGRPGPPGQQHLNQVYSFVPIPGAQQHKRPRRRYEEIERMYKCGWNGCEKAYGTLNHLNAHVTMQSHGTKRTPEEFKEIRKEWKARKKEEENARKAEEDRARAAGMPVDGQNIAEGSHAGYAPPRPVQLPPIGYTPNSNAPNQYQAPAGASVQQLQDYPAHNNMQQQYSGYPAAPYGAPNNMQYSQL